jgi:replicative DNA helicase
MDRDKKRSLDSMTSGVEVHDMLPGGARAWVSIAAFNCDAASEAYRDECAKARPELSYRVRKFFT